MEIFHNTTVIPSNKCCRPNYYVYWTFIY